MQQNKSEIKFKCRGKNCDYEVSPSDKIRHLEKHHPRFMKLIIDARLTGENVDINKFFWENTE